MYGGGKGREGGGREESNVVGRDCVGERKERALERERKGGKPCIIGRWDAWEGGVRRES